MYLSLLLKNALYILFLCPGRHFKLRLFIVSSTIAFGYSDAIKIYLPELEYFMSFIEPIDSYSSWGFYFDNGKE